jgi:uncharacterized membrane protein (Fun14 family)
MNEHQSVHELGKFHGESATYDTGLSASSSVGDTAFPFLEMGTSFVIGLAIGYFVKKSFKFLLLFLGLGLVTLFILESQGYFHVDDQVIQDGVSTGVDSFQNVVNMLKERLSNMELSSGAGAVAGFFAGLKFG